MIGVNIRLVKEHQIVKLISPMLIEYFSPLNLNYFWNFGSLAGTCLVFQLITGIALAMHYTPHIDLAFHSVEHIMRDVNYGWVLRYMHANGASMFFIVVYLHFFRGLYYSSYTYPRNLVWEIGVIILLLMILTAFLGYVLPWGQMSFWAATVITNLCSAIPIIGETIVPWLWGGFSVDNATLNRFFSFHYLFPFLITGLVIVHLLVLHDYGSNNSLGIPCNKSVIQFHSYFTIKDFLGIIIGLFIYFVFVFFYPNLLGHPDNYIPANSLVTPAHIVPEWYFLPFYAILRSVPDKLAGVIAMLCAIIILLVFPHLINHTLNSTRSSNLQFLHEFFFWLFVGNCFFLGFIGGKPIEDPYFNLGQIATILYFNYFIVVLPVLSSISKIFNSKN